MCTSLATSRPSREIKAQTTPRKHFFSAHIHKNTANVCALNSLNTIAPTHSNGGVKCPLRLLIRIATQCIRAGESVQRLEIDPLTPTSAQTCTFAARCVCVCVRYTYVASCDECQSGCKKLMRDGEGRHASPGQIIRRTDGVMFFVSLIAKASFCRRTCAFSIIANYAAGVRSRPATVHSCIS